MAQSFRSRYLGTMSENEQRLKAAFVALAAAAAAEVTRRSGDDGTVPRRHSFEVQQAITVLILLFFLGRNSQGNRAPFEILPDGTLFPLSTYMRILWQGISDVTRVGIERNTTMMEGKLPPELTSRLRQMGKMQGAMLTGSGWRLGLLAQYKAPHLWLDPNGNTLTERIWNVTNNTRRRVDTFLDQHIARGVAAATMARDLETFLVPGRKLRDLKAPYGIDASNEATRLAVTEWARAHATAEEASAAMNPFVDKLQWNTSPGHKKLDICDQHVVNGPYDLDNHPFMPAHPGCACFWSNVTVPNPAAVATNLRDRAAQHPFGFLPNPLAPEQFQQFLLRGR